jgi:ribulose-phosphate 3-epimerase
MSVQIAPSILSADFARLADEAAAVADAADWLHVDVMDNHFVPNLTIGLPVVESLAKATSLPLDCHLMITDPDRWAPGYAEAGAGSVTIHAEAAADAVQTARAIRAAGARAGLAIKPATTFTDVRDVLPEFDMLLVMTVEPGFGGQSFMGDMMAKVSEARRYLRDTGSQIWLQVDGGVSLDTIEICAESGADVFVAGSAVYAAGDPAAVVRALRAKAESAVRELP